MLLERTTYAVYCRDFRSIKCAGIAGGLAAIEHKLTYRTHPWPHEKEKLGAGCKAKGPQIISIICDTRYLRHPRLSDGSRGGVRIGGDPGGDPNVSSVIFGWILRA